MNPAVLFLAGGAGLAVVLSAVVWLFSRPRKVVEDPNQARANLRALRHGTSPGAPGRPNPGMPPRRSGTGGSGGIRVLGNETPDGSDSDLGSGTGTGSDHAADGR